MKFLTATETDEFLATVAQRVAALPAELTTSFLFDWAGQPVRIVLSGVKETAFFTDAIAHRLVTASDTYAELTLYVVDDCIASTVLPTPFWQEHDFDEYGRLGGLGEANYASYDSNNQVFSILSRQSGRGMMWVRDVTSLPEWERSFPFRTLLYQWFRRGPFLFIHAGAVGTAEGGVLLTGRGGSGKSTATLACLSSNLKYAGDDFVMMDTDTLTVHSLYNVAKLEASNLHRFPDLAPFIVNRQSLPEQKGQVFLQFCRPETLISEFPIRAIFLPQFTGNETTTLRPATKAEALRALAPSTIGLLKAEASILTYIANLVHRLPCYWLNTGTKLDTIPDTISQFLNTHSDDR